MNGVANIKPQMAALAMKDISGTSLRKDNIATSNTSKSSVSNKSAGSNKTTEKNFSQVLEDKDAPIRSESSDVLPNNSRGPEKNSGRSESVGPQNNESTSESSEAVNREKAMSVFLDQMQAQLGVEPEKIVEAFSKLELNDLALPPEETMDKVIDALDLSESQEKVAGTLYSEMLAMSAAASMSKYLADQKQTAQMEVLSPREAARRDLNKSIDTMNSNFFSQPAMPSTMKKAQAGQAYGAQIGKPMMNSAQPDMATGKMVIPEGMTLPKGIELNSINLEQALAATQTQQPMDMAALTPEAIAADPMPAIQQLEKELALLEKISPNDPELPIMKQTLMQLKEAVQQPAASTQSSIDLSAMNAKMGNQAYAAAPVAATGMAVRTDSASGEMSSGSEDLTDGKKDSSLDSLGQVDARRTMTANTKDFIVNAPKPTTADIQANVKEVISQAQFLAKKGGGEMKVKLNPEGLGEVNLKVGMQNGQLNVEMVTSNDEAKKILEKGISELKSSLAEHKLHIEHIKIETPKETSNQMNQQFDQADKQFQQRFLQDFRDQNSGFRREFFDIAPAKVPGSNIRDNASNAGYDPSAKRRSERRLDLVA